MKQYKLAVITSHPVQYQAPLLQKLARSPQIDLCVYYGSDKSMRGSLDPGFGVPIKWDRRLLDGYRYHFVGKNHQSSIKDHSGRLRKPRLTAEFVRERYDAVYIHSYATLLSLEGYLAAWISRTPVFLRTESELIRRRHRLIRAIKEVFLRGLFRGTKGFLAIGSQNRAFYHHYGIADERIFHTPYSVDNDFFGEERNRWLPERDRLKKEMGFEKDQPVIVFSGKLIERKRPMDLAKAYARLVKAGASAGLLFIGDGEMRPVLEEFAKANGLTSMVIAGFRNQSEISRCYIIGDVLVLPSEFDPWGLVVNEAMLFSMPVVVSSMVGAGSDLVIDDETGYVFPVGDTTNLQKILGRLLGNRPLRERMGLAANSLIERWNYDICVREILRALNSLTS